MLSTRFLLAFIAATFLQQGSAFLQPSTVVASATNTSSNNMSPLESTSTAVANNYWNRETSSPKQYDASKEIVKEARIICISDPDDDANKLLYNAENLEGTGAKIIAIGSKTEDFDIQSLIDQKANVIFCSHKGSREPLAKLLKAIPTIEWVQCRSAGIDFVMSDTFSSSNVIATNAKGCFSSTLGEYTMMAIAYFAKDLPRLLRQKSDKNWERYCVEEIRGKSLGIVGYGDIGQSAARLAKAYGMNIKTLRRNPEKSQDDPFVDVVYPSDRESLNRIMSECDYILCAAPLTADTEGLFDKEAFDHAKKDSVFINVGRGPIVDEDALIDALKAGNLKGAALDVFATEPLPVESELWTLDNVLMSPHNMDATPTFLHEATELFVEENLPRFVRGMNLLNPVNKSAGY